MTTAYPLYNPQMEHESCGVGAVVDLSGQATHRTVSDALTIVERLSHRSGSDALGTTGDGVGIMTMLPHPLFSKWAQSRGIRLGNAGDYAAGMFFLPDDEISLQNAVGIFEGLAASEGLEVMAWREVPVKPGLLGAGALRSMPRIRQCFIPRPRGVEAGLDFERRLYILRRLFEKQQTDTYICSLSSRTIVYKGMMLVPQLRAFYGDLQSEDFTAQAAMVHSRFSTNTLPSWAKAHPQRMLLHNGEINTIRGNADRMHAREETMDSPVMGADMRRVLPVVEAQGSDSQMLDNALEFLYMNGMPLPLAAMVLLPEPWQNQREKTPWRDLYQYYSTMMEPWDGPAAILYSDGETVCASLDRNGLRPLRCALTDENRLILSSEAGVLFEESPRIVKRWRLEAGGLLVADLRTGELLGSAAIKTRFAAMRPYGQWLEGMVRLKDLPPARTTDSPMDGEERLALCRAFGYDREDLREIILPMASAGSEPIVSMGADEPLAVLSKTHPALSSYFKQRFAQVTNPPMDAIREKIKTDQSIYIGDDGNLLAPCPENCVVIELDSPVLTSDQLQRIRALQHPSFRVRTLSLLYSREGTLKAALDRLFADCDEACRERVNIVILSDRGLDAHHLAIPSLLAVSALEQHLIRIKKRTAVSVILESGEPRDVHQLALLVGYGARAVNPYLAHECVTQLCLSGQLDIPVEQALKNYDRALSEGVLKIASKMGVSTLQAYQSAQLFETIGLDAALVDTYFSNTPHYLGGTGLNRIEAGIRWHHERAFIHPPAAGALTNAGRHHLRKGEDAEAHLYTPEVIHTLQQAVQTNDQALFNRYAAMVENDGPRTLRSLLDFRYESCKPVPLSEVEPVEAIVKRFKTGAMSYGSISREAHECLALAMNRLGGSSNSGEGGELPERFGTELNSAVKQVASGRFGVTRDYLHSAKEIQIKMAQGAKPGEGGHLPGSKVSAEIARTRCSTPGISLISPPPHHDIYSIEDLAQLIYDLQCANESARVTIKLVSTGGVGTIASGAAKAGARGILISGGEGGTGAAPMSSVHHAGLPWEIGLAEAHQVLCRNGLRQLVTLETDGKLMDGHDVAVALLLGAEEFSFATAPLVALGCRMMRVCHLGSCPFGIATQRPELRKRFAGKPEYVERFMYFVAQQLREIMARLGARKVDELVGRSDLLKAKAASPLDLTSITGFSRNVHCRPESAFDFHLSERADVQFAQSQRALLNTDRAFGTMLKGDQSLTVRGCGGQSFGAFLSQGQQITLYGESNDYFGKGLSGGILAVCPPHEGKWNPDDALIGNVALYGATSGQAYVAGLAGERFCVRNSGATAVAEGVGDHGCEYMTGGRVAILGPVGLNFAAGMSGGIAYVLDEDQSLSRRVSPGSVEVWPVSPEGAAELRDMIEAHVRMTGSKKGAAILERFEETLPRFKMLLSGEYRRFLEESERNETEC